jgi:hypothetical protein
MAILAAPTSEPSVALRPRFDLVSALLPAARLLLRFRTAISSVSLFLLLRVWVAASLAFGSLFIASRLTIWHALLMARLLTVNSALFAASAVSTVWNHKASRRLKKKLEFEFFVLILGPGGNALCLAIFWPGWIIAIAAVWSVWSGVGPAGNQV